MVVVPLVHDHKHENCKVDYESGRGFRLSLRWPSSKNHNSNKNPGKRIVPAFSIQALQSNTIVAPPPKCGIFEKKPIKPTMFRKFYKRGNFPASIEFSSSCKLLAWKIQPDKLDYHYYLPIVFEGLAELQYPYTYIVHEAIDGMLSKAPYKVLPVVPQLIMPIKNALSTKWPEILCNTMKAMQMLVNKCDRVGVALVPYYRQLLLVFNLFKDKNNNLGSVVDYTTTRSENLADMIDQTLQALERNGGPDAFINIKYMVPTYESCVLN